MPSGTRPVIRPGCLVLFRLQGSDSVTHYVCGFVPEDKVQEFSPLFLHRRPTILKFSAIIATNGKLSSVLAKGR
jgi:hypothetical protein